ncbi:MAG: glutaredoxin [Flavobacteriaceae bacterium]
MKITLYGKKGHAHTVAFKNFLRMAEVAFDYKDIFKDEEAKAHTRELYDGHLKFPTLFVDEEIYLTPSSDVFNNVMKDLKLRG